MDRSLSAAVSRSADIFSEQIRRAPKARAVPQQAPANVPMRNYRVSYLSTDGSLIENTMRARQHPTFEDAFAALSHGAIVQTRRGVMSVEDVLPGDDLRLADGTFDTLLWRGSISLQPDASKQRHLTRITADAMGFNRPAPDLVLGPSARILHRASGVRRLTGCDAAFVPASDFIDGNHVLSLAPNAPLNVYQLGFKQQRCLSVNGIEIETLHPGTAFALGLRGDVLNEYMTLFPHKSSLEAFGLMEHPRLRLRDLELLG
ncbi:MAG: Hint domain-containing protein [Pseudomonadota bacterium]